MRDDPFREQFDELLDEANEALSGRTREAYDDERETLLDAADALVDHLSEDAGDPPPPTLRRAQRIKTDIEELDPEDDDFREDADRLRYRLERLADQVDFEDELELVFEGDARIKARRKARQARAAAAAVELSETAQILLGPVDDAFEDAEDRDKFVNHAINYVMDVPRGRSALFQQMYARTLLSAARLSLDLEFPDEPGNDTTSGGGDTTPSNGGGGTIGGGGGSDTIVTDTGGGTIGSGVGGDTIITDTGATVDGGVGIDTISTDTHETIDGGEGNDTIDHGEETRDGHAGPGIVLHEVEVHNDVIDPTGPVIHHDPRPVIDDDLFVLVTKHFERGPPGRREIRKWLSDLGIESVEELARLPASVPAGTSPGAYLYERLIKITNPRRHAHIPSASAWEELIQGAVHKINK